MNSPKFNESFPELGFGWCLTTPAAPGRAENWVSCRGAVEHVQKGETAGFPETAHGAEHTWRLNKHEQKGSVSLSSPQCHLLPWWGVRLGEDAGGAQGLIDCFLINQLDFKNLQLSCSSPCVSIFLPSSHTTKAWSLPTAFIFSCFHTLLEIKWFVCSHNMPPIL